MTAAWGQGGGDAPRELLACHVGTFSLSLRGAIIRHEVNVGSGISPHPIASRPLQVFLCHASGDKPAVRELYKKLRTDGFRPWLDEADLLPGQDWQREIPNRLRDSDVVVVCLSCQSTIKTGYVQKEIKHALDAADEQPEGEIFLIPLRLETCEVPQRLARWHWVDLFELHGYEKLLRALDARSKSLAKWAASREMSIRRDEGADGIPDRPFDPRPPDTPSLPMTRAELRELGYIAPIATVSSILRRGILSYRRAEGVARASIALQDVVQLRANTVIAGRSLHDYASLYISPRNPMLFKRSSIHDRICVLRVSADVLDIPDVIITDSNAGSKYVRYGLAPAGLAIVDRDRTLAESWTHKDQIDQWRHSAQKCAEVLVPDSVPPRYVIGAYVSCDKSRRSLEQLVPDLPITVDSHLFFQQGAQ